MIILENIASVCQVKELESLSKTHFGIIVAYIHYPERRIRDTS